jgi:phosphoserine phosphatase RsbU/P
MREAPRVPGFRIASWYEACTQLSGDFNQFVPLADGHLAIAQGDVSGHGARAGLLMAIANKLVELYARQYTDPRQAVIQIQRAMAEDLGGRSFITMIYGILDPAASVLRWVRAGHNPALVWRAATARVEALRPAGMAVGMPMHEAFARGLALCETRLDPGDLLVIATDGIAESMDAKEEEFSPERLEAVIAAHASRGPAATLAAVQAAVAAHRGGQPANDDQSMILLARDPAGLPGPGPG